MILLTEKFPGERTKFKDHRFVDVESLKKSEKFIHIFYCYFDDSRYFIFIFAELEKSVNVGFASTKYDCK